MTPSQVLKRVVAELVGQRCEGIDNPYGSILSIDIGPLDIRSGDPLGAKPHGWRHLTILSPWRLQSSRAVLADWNVDGGTGGFLSEIIRQLVGDVVSAASTTGPAWDLSLTWKSGLVLTVFADSNDERDEAWYILGTDGLEVEARPDVSRVQIRPKR